MIVIENGPAFQKNRRSIVNAVIGIQLEIKADQPWSSQL